MKNVIGLMVLLTTIISGGLVIYSEAGSSGDDLSIQKTEIAGKIIQQDAQADPDNISEGNSIHLVVNASRQETFTPSQVKNISHNIYWDDNDVPNWANFTQGYIKIKWDSSICGLVSVQSGLFDTWLYRTIRPGEVVLWTWQIGTPPLTNSQSEVAFTVTFKGTDAGGTTDLTYAIASSTGGSRTWFWAGYGAHNWIQVNAVIEYQLLDTTPPTGSIVIQSGAKYINTTTTTLTLSAEDPESGVPEMRFSNDNYNWFPWEPYAVTKIWYLAPYADGEQTVYAEFKNGAGLTAVATDTIIYVTKPYIESITPPEALPTEEILVQGFNFDPVAANNKVKFTLGDKSVEMTPFWSNLDTAQLKVYVPCDFSGEVKVQVVNYLGTSNECSFKILNFTEGLNKVITQLETMVIDENITVDTRQMLQKALEYCQQAQESYNLNDYINVLDFFSGAMERIALAARQEHLDIWYKLNTLISARAALLQSTLTVEQSKMMVDVLSNYDVPDTAWTSVLEALKLTNHVLSRYAEGNLHLTMEQLKDVVNNLNNAGIPEMTDHIVLSLIESITLPLKDAKEVLMGSYGADDHYTIEISAVLDEIVLKMADKDYIGVLDSAGQYWKKVAPPPEFSATATGVQTLAATTGSTPYIIRCSCYTRWVKHIIGLPMTPPQIKYRRFDDSDGPKIKFVVRDGNNESEEVKDTDYIVIESIGRVFRWRPYEELKKCSQLRLVPTTDNIFFTWRIPADPWWAGSATDVFDYPIKNIPIGSSYTETIKLSIQASPWPPWPSLAEGTVATMILTVRRPSEAEYTAEVTPPSYELFGDYGLIPEKDESCGCKLSGKWATGPGMQEYKEWPVYIPKYIAVGVPKTFSSGYCDDTDKLTLSCTGGPYNCSSSNRVYSFPDAVRYRWELTKGFGVFPYGNFGKGVVFTASKPGEIEFATSAENFTSDHQDGPVLKSGKTTAVKLDLQIGDIFEDKEETEGAYITLNGDDDNINGKPDYLDTDKPLRKSEKGKDIIVPDDELVRLKIQLDPRPPELRITLADLAKGKIKVWEVKNNKWTQIIGIGLYKYEKAWNANNLPDELWVEGIEASNKARDVTLRLTAAYPIPASTNWLVFASDTVRLTIPEVKVDLQAKGVPEDTEETKGGFVMLNYDNDNNNGIPDLDPLDIIVNNEDDLLEITLEIKPEGISKGTMTLEAKQGGDKIKVWEKETKETVVTLPKNWNADQMPKKLYVEGIKTSTVERDIELQLKWTDPDTKNEIPDKVRLTVVKVNLDIAGVADAEEETKGKIVVRNADGNNAPRKKIILEKVLPQIWAGNTLLSRNKNNVKVFDAVTGGNEITFNGNDNKFANTSLPKDLWVEGLTESTTMTDTVITLEAVDIGEINDKINFTVLWVSEITGKTIDKLSPSTENAARDYIVSKNFEDLGVWKKGEDRYGFGIELKGTVKPSDFNQSVVLQRDVAYRYFMDTINGSSFWRKRDFSATVPPGNDTGNIVYRDDNPQSGDSRGEIYDWDIPGISFWSEVFGTIVRARSNFKQYAVYNDDGTDIRCSLIYNWYCVRSGKKTGPANTDWSQENSFKDEGDNKVVFGSHKDMTWDLGHPSVTGITPNSGDNKNQYLFVTITGKGFAYGATVLLKKGPTEIPALKDKSTVFSPTKITGYFDLYRNPIGEYNLMVKNLEDDVQGELINGFTIIKPEK